MKERSIFSYWWFWLLLVGIALILVSALLHLGIKTNTQFAWWIFAAGVLLALLGIILAFVSYFTEPRCVPVAAASATTDEFGCDNLVSTEKSSSHMEVKTPGLATTNLPQLQRGFTASGMDLSALAPSPK